MRECGGEARPTRREAARPLRGRRSGCAAPILTAEGANRRSPGAKRQRYEEARGEVGEAAALAVAIEDAGLVTGGEPAEVLRRADRAAALLTGLVKVFSQR